MLAPPFTRENAAENARKAVISREKNRAAKKSALILACDPSQAQTRAKLQVDKILTWMENCKDKDTYANLVAMLDRIWNKAFPTQGAVKSRIKDRQPQAAPIPEGQPKAVDQNTNGDT